VIEQPDWHWLRRETNVLEIDFRVPSVVRASAE
jgi:hypothetical protein